MMNFYHEHVDDMLEWLLVGLTAAGLFYGLFLAITHHLA